MPPPGSVDAGRVPKSDGPIGFDGFVLDHARFELRRSGVVVHVEPRVFDVLADLVANRDRVVSKTELLDNVWGDRFVGESALTSRIKGVRRAVGDDGTRQGVIRTVHGRGYQFVADVAPAAGIVPRWPGKSEGGQQIRYCVAADGARIAYATSGSGPPLVKAATFMTHLDLEWRSLVWGHWLAALSDGHRLIRYDERGSGMSETDPKEWSFSAWATDLETVVDAAHLGRFPLIGLSQGGPLAIAFAAAHPERVSALVLVGAYSRGRMVRATSAEERDEAALDVQLARVAWRRDDDTFFQVFASQFLPEASMQHRAEFNHLQRATTTPDNAGKFLEIFARIDVAELLPRVECPTLVIHARRDQRVPIEQAIELASAIPDSRLIALDSGNHLLTADEPAWPVFVEELEKVLNEHAAANPDGATPRTP